MRMIDRIRHSLVPCLILSLLVSAFSWTCVAQSSAVQQQSGASSSKAFVTLQGNVHPFATLKNDSGPAPDSLAMNRMLLLLQRTPEQESALQKLLQDQQDKNSPSYHKWLTPEEFGQQFGPPDDTLNQVKAWLALQGFQVARTTAGRNILEISGTAGQVKSAFHTEIHKYKVQGNEYFANQSDPQIPAGLAPVLKGFVSLNNFPTASEMRYARLAATSSMAGKSGPQPLFTYPQSGCSSAGNCYGVTPADFATIYDVAPLYTAGIDGSGQTIAVASGSNIHLSDVQNFRTLFGLPANNTVITVADADPGIVVGEEIEANFAVQWAGAVAKNATIQLVVSQSTFTSRGVDLAAVYVVDNNLAPILTESLSECEDALGSSGTVFYSSLWEQAAAEGITVVIPTGDTGSAACDNPITEFAATKGVAISGVASTPFNVAVGGTDFNQVGNWSTYWDSSNGANGSSAISYIPETTWNDTCTENGVNGCASPSTTGSDLFAGGGGFSKYNQQPPWQLVGSFPLQGSRGIPDVSMFAGDGNNGSFYIICEEDGQAGGPGCDLNAPYLDFVNIGGTTGAAATFAGIMALVNQQTGSRQGNANFVIYGLAAVPGSSVFHDVTLGSNSVACIGGSPYCSNTSSAKGQYGYLGDANDAFWSAFTGYDVATGWGSVDANVLVNQWSSIKFQATTTTLASFSPTTLTHGQPANFTINVTANGGGGTPTGDVALIVKPSTGNSFAADYFTLQNGTISGSTTFLPGGTYQISAHYAGDSTFATSDSAPITITVGPQASQIVLALAFTSGGSLVCITNDNGPPSYDYGNPLYAIYGIVNTSGTACTGVNTTNSPTGTVALTDNGAPLDAGTYTLNTRGHFQDASESLTPGQHNVSAQYSGDPSYSASTTTAPLSISVTQGQTTMTLASSATIVLAGTNVTLTATVNTSSVAAAPSGTIFFSSPSGNIGTASLVPMMLPSGRIAGVATLTYAPQNTVTISAHYNGDTNYGGSQAAPVTITSGNPDFTFVAPSNPLVVNAGSSGSATLTLTSVLGYTGSVSFACPAAASLPPGITCSVNPSPVTVPGDGTPVSTTLTITSQAPSVIPNTPAQLIYHPRDLRFPRGPLAVVALYLVLLSSVLLLGVWQFRVSQLRRRVLVFATSAAVVLFAGSCSSVNQPSNFNAASTLTLSSSGSKAAQGTPVDLRAFVSANHTVSGTVDFFDAGAPLAQGVAVATGRASYTTSTLVVGIHSITAKYSGDSRTNPANTANPFAQAITGQFSFQVMATAPGITHPVNVTVTLQ